MTTRFTVDGKKVSLLGYGAMRLPTVDGGHANSWMLDASKKDIDQAHLNRQVRRMLEAGVNYFDTAPVYGPQGERVRPRGLRDCDEALELRSDALVAQGLPGDVCEVA